MTGNVRIRYQWRAFVQPLWQCKDNKYYIFWGCVCSLWDPACNAHAPHCHLWPVRLYHFFLPHYLINGTIFKTTLLNTKCMFWFSLQLLSKTLLMLWRNERNMTKMYTGSSCKVVNLVRF
jgi:hypothetical protein